MQKLGPRLCFDRSIFIPWPDEKSARRGHESTLPSFLCVLDRGAVRSRQRRRSSQGEDPRNGSRDGCGIARSPDIFHFTKRGAMEGKKVEQYYSPPPKLGKWEGFRVFLWNSETGQFLGRTGASWAKILLFYVIFYAVLAGFFGAMLTVFYQTLDPNAPKWQLENSLIGSNPGLGFRPMPPASNVESTLIWYKASDEGNFLHWTKELDKFLEEYQKPSGATGNGAQKRMICDYGKPPAPGKVCDVDMTLWGQCTKENKYGFNKSAPCIFLKLNKIFGWKPEYYNDTKNLPGTMPTDLQEHIKQEEHAHRLDTVWVSCSGENPADVENMGAIQYIPRRGFPGYYFPFTNTPGYLSPLVAVFFERPKYGVLINIECKAWAHNIVHDRYERRGSVHFELMVD